MKKDRDKLTGRTRFVAQRIGTIRKREVLVFQVEVAWPDGPPDSNGMPQYLRGTGWRDATTADISTAQGMIGT